MKKLRNSSLTTFFWRLMVLYMLNVCIDAPDALLHHMPEDLSYNDQESIAEVILEKVLGYENAIPEYDDRETDQNLVFKTSLTLDNFTLPETDSKLGLLACQANTLNRSLYLLYFPIQYLDIPSPPPKPDVV
ncbi:hypothetical protein BKI52_39305 [marine bacterium AO1-C]|nr:hypothetical protein BKI52_39305 [marine bacterium AO1-C]